MGIYDQQQSFKISPFYNKEERQARRAEVKEAKEGKSGKEKRQAAREVRKKQRSEGRRGVEKTIKKATEVVKKVRDSNVGRAVEGAVKVAQNLKAGKIKSAIEQGKSTVKGIKEKNKAT